MRLLCVFIALSVLYPTIDSYDVDASIAPITKCNIGTNIHNASCYIECDRAHEYSSIKQVSCSDATTCVIHCASSMCMTPSIIRAEDAASLNITSSATDCLSYSTIYLPNHGNVTIHAHSAPHAFSSNALHSGSSTNSIHIHCGHHHNRSARAYTDNICDDLWLNASTAQHLYIAITHTSMNRAQITCPTDTHSTCIINATHAISLQNTIITATHTVYLYIGSETNVSHTKVQCDHLMTRYDDGSIQCIEGPPIYPHTSSFPIDITATAITRRDGNNDRDLLHMFLSLPFRIYVWIILCAVILCICCTVLCMKYTCKWLMKRKPRMRNARTRTLENIRHVLSDASVVQDVKRMLALASSNKSQIIDTESVRVSKPDISPHHDAVNSSSTNEIDTMDIGDKVDRYELDDELYMMSSMMPFSAPCHAYPATIVEDGKNIEMDIYNQANDAFSFDDEADHKHKPKKKKSMKIPEYLKFRKRCVSESGAKSLSEKGFTVNRLYGMNMNISEWKEDDTDHKELALEEKEENEDTISEASTLTLMEIEDSTFTVRDNAIATFTMDGADLSMDGSGHVGYLNTLREQRDEAESESEHEDEGEEETPPYDGHFRYQTEGSETNPLSNFKLPPKVTPGSYL